MTGATKHPIHPGDAVRHGCLEPLQMTVPKEAEREALEAGDAVTMEPSAEVIAIRPLDPVIREVQDFFAELVPPEAKVSEELIRERRVEAGRESHA